MITQTRRKFFAMCAAACGVFAIKPRGIRLGGLKEGQEFDLRDGRRAKLCRASSDVKKSRFVEMHDGGVRHAWSPKRLVGVTMADAAKGRLSFVG